MVSQSLYEDQPAMATHQDWRFDHQQSLDHHLNRDLFHHIFLMADLEVALVGGRFHLTHSFQVL